MVFLRLKGPFVVYLWIISIIIYCIARLIFIRRNNTKTNIRKEITMFIFMNYSFVFFIQTLLPNINYQYTGFFQFTDWNISINSDISEVNLVPFRTIYEYLFRTNTHVDNWSYVAFYNIIGSIVLYVPLGLLLPIIRSKFRSISIIGIGAILAIVTETMQYFIGRSSDIDDVILAIIGVSIGLLLYRTLIILFELLFKMHRKEKLSNM